MCLAAMPNDDRLRTDFQRLDRAAWYGRNIQAAERLNQPETRRGVVAHGVAGHDHPVIGGQPDGARFSDQVADRQHQSVRIDDDALPTRSVPRSVAVKASSGISVW